MILELQSRTVCVLLSGTLLTRMGTLYVFSTRMTSATTVPSAKSVRFSLNLKISRATRETALHDSGENTAELTAVRGSD